MYCFSACSLRTTVHFNSATEFYLLLCHCIMLINLLFYEWLYVVALCRGKVGVMSLEVQCFLLSLRLPLSRYLYLCWCVIAMVGSILFSLMSLSKLNTALHCAFPCLRCCFNLLCRYLSLKLFLFCNLFFYLIFVLWITLNDMLCIFLGYFVTNYYINGSS